MVNLLPPQQKWELRQEEKYKLFLILVISVIVFSVALSLVLLTVKIYISGNLQGNKIVAASSLQEQEKGIVATNKNLENLDSFYGKSSDFAQFLENISGILPVGIRLTSVSLVSLKDGGFSASLQGFSPTREILLQMKNNLGEKEDFKDINFPVSNWVKPDNVDFIVNFKVGI